MLGITPYVPIVSPVQLDIVARELFHNLERSSSPLHRFSLLSDFFKRTRVLPEIWTASYYHSLYPLLSACVQHEYVCWIDPAVWLDILYVLRVLGKHNGMLEQESVDETKDSAWEKCCLAHAAVRRFREMFDILHSSQLITAELTEDEWVHVLNAETTGGDPFRHFADALLRHGDIPRFLRHAVTRWEHARNDGKRAGVILLDSMVPVEKQHGLILHIDAAFVKSDVLRVHFNNPLDEENIDTVLQLMDAATAAFVTVRKHLRSDPAPCECTVSFHEQEAKFSGESMGLAVGVLIAMHFQRKFNTALRWSLQPHLIFAGGIDSNAQVREMPAQVLDAKLRSAFFSPASGIVLHAIHAETARVRIRQLQQQHPFRQFEIYGVSSLDDCVSAPGVVASDFRSRYERIKEFVYRHAIVLLASLIVALGISAGYFWWKSVYDYPDMEYVHGKSIEYNALVYNPRRHGGWQFRDHNEIRKAELSFGDLEIGADATRNIWLWNMTPSSLDVDLAIEGEHTDQWYISWNGGRQRITPTDSLRVMVKYVPTRASELNEAFFTIRDSKNGNLLKQMRLFGKAGPPTNAGYALELDGVDNMLFFGEHAIAFDNDEGTLEFWFRMDGDVGCIFSNNRNIPSQPSMQNMTLAIMNDTLQIHVGNHFSCTPLYNKNISGSGTWHHLALAFSRMGKRIHVLLDGEVIYDKSGEFIIEWVKNPYVTFGAYNDGQQHHEAMFKGAIDEIRVWDSALSPTVIRSRMNQKVNALSKGLLGYWDFDVISEVSAHNANERSQDGLLLHRPNFVRSGAVLDPPKRDILLVEGPFGNPAVELQSTRWMQCGSDPINASLERTYAIRFRYDGGDRVQYFTVMNQDAVLNFSSFGPSVSSYNRTWTPNPGWNSVVARVDSEQNVEIFLNGAFLYTLTSAEFRRGPAYRYEGLHVGIFHDKYNNFGKNQYDSRRPELLRRKGVADVRVWNRRVGNDVIRKYERGEDTPDGLVAHWPLDTLPDDENNYRDLVNGHLLHVWRYVGWK